MKQTTLSKLLLIVFVFCSSIGLIAQNKYTLTPNKRPGTLHYLYVSPEGAVNCTDDETLIKNVANHYNDIIRLRDGDGTRNLSPINGSPEGITTATFAVTYTGFTPQAQAAFQRAVDIWSTLITSSQTIRINATFSALGTNVLGSAGPYSFEGLTFGSTTSWYADALADALLGSDASPQLQDIDASFSSTYPNFYFGLDGVPQAGKIDFVSLVMHELGHGLGFLGSGRANNSNPPCTNTIGQGCWGYVSGVTIPVIFDRSVQNASSISIMNTSVNANPSTSLFTFITTNNLFFAGINVKSVNANAPARLYAPTTYANASTYSHFDEATYPPSSSNALMTPTLASNEVQQSPGKLACSLFKDIGWTMAGACNAVVSIELADFSATSVGKKNVVKWITVSEKDNPLFKIQRSTDGKNFTTIGQLKGAMTTNTPQCYTFVDETPQESINYYRLQFVESDGTSYVSKTVALNNLSKGTFWVQPSIVQNKLTLVTADIANSNLPFTVSDIIGRIVKKGIFPNNQTTMQLDVFDLTNGQYFIALQNYPIQRFVKQ